MQKQVQDMDWINISLIVRWSLGWALVLRLQELPKGVKRKNERWIVIIPARNEAKTLPQLLTSLKYQTERPDSVIVVDDNSVDDTRNIALRYAKELPLKIVKVIEPPEKWCGKTWALHQGVIASKDSQSTDDDILIFLDADTEPSPTCLQRLIQALKEYGGLVSVQPYHRTEKPYEQLSVLFNLVGLMAVPLGQNCGVAFGPAMSTTRADYEKSGGHHAVSDKVVEDWFLAHCYEKKGLNVSAFIGYKQICYRMYPGGTGDMVSGFNKNFATAAGEVHWLWMIAILLWLSGLFWAAWCLPAAIFGWPMVGTIDIMPNLIIYCSYSLQLTCLTHRVGNFSWIQLILPIPALFFLGVFLQAIINLEKGQVYWKGRRVKTR